DGRSRALDANGVMGRSVKGCQKIHRLSAPLLQVERSSLRARLMFVDDNLPRRIGLDRNVRPPHGHIKLPADRQHRIANRLAIESLLGKSGVILRGIGTRAL